MTSFQLKSIEYNTKPIKMIMQNENGPCPVIAIGNCLMLLGNLHLPAQLESISFSELIERIGNYLISTSADSSQQVEVDAQNLNDALSLLPSLDKGLDVNCYFTKSDAFEFTSAISIFDCCRLSLFHGWVISPETDDPQTFELVAKKLKSYNALVDLVVRGDALNSKQTHTSDDDEVLAQTAVCREFMQDTSTQLTVAGIKSIKDILPEDRPSVLFRNNHFLTLIKWQGNLFTLVTDHGYLNSPIVWESLDSISGSSTHYDCSFQLLDPELPTYRQSLSEMDRKTAAVYSNGQAGPSSNHRNIDELDPEYFTLFFNFFAFLTAFSLRLSLYPLVFCWQWSFKMKKIGVIESKSEELRPTVIL